MGIDPVTLALASFAVTATSAVMGNKAQKEAADEQEKARKQQQGMQAEQSAREKRQQIREERIKRAKIMQAAENTGTSGSSGEYGSISGLSTQLGSNLGFNANMISRANAISANQQNAADAMTTASNWGAVGSIAGSIFAKTSSSLFNIGGPTSTAPTMQGAGTPTENWIDSGGLGR